MDKPPEKKEEDSIAKIYYKKGVKDGMGIERKLMYKWIDKAKIEEVLNKWLGCVGDGKEWNLEADDIRKMLKGEK